MHTKRAHVTMDGKEFELLERYEAQFGETPPVAFLHPQTSKRIIMDALRNNRPINEKDLVAESDIPLIPRAVIARSTTKTGRRPARFTRLRNSKL